MDTQDNNSPADPDDAQDSVAPQFVPASLSEQDGEAIDALLAGRVAGADDARRMPIPPGVGRDRVQRCDQWMKLIDAGMSGDDLGVDDKPTTMGDALVQRTLAAVREQQQRERFAQQIDMLRAPRQSLGIGWGRLAMSAAVLILGLSLLMPVLEQNHNQAVSAVCASNMSLAGQGFAQYAADHDGQMPRRALRVGDVWWQVGQPIGSNDPAHVDEAAPVQSNSAHLFVLVRRGYVSPRDLACPANPHASQKVHPSQRDWLTPQAVSFSYQNQYTDKPMHLTTGRRAASFAILADKNPLFVASADPRTGQIRIHFDASRSTVESSRMHAGSGQNVLFADASVLWKVRPTIQIDDPDAASADQDNIWTLRNVETYNGNEAPQDESDSFLVP